MEFPPLPDSDTESLILEDDEICKSMVEHPEIIQPKIDIDFTLRTAPSIEVQLYSLPSSTATTPEEPKLKRHIGFKPCTLEQLENDIVESACSGSESMFYVVQALHEHFSRSKGYTQKDKTNIKSNLIGRIHAKRLPQEKIAEVEKIFSNFFN